ncbi:hypothetical protein [Pseudomonas sp. GL-B-19]|uniref:hypothetical protein n=1 Tax=Pseudomonas sp. GL-B-19 TaxID=2832393 RepID=UPI001CBC40A4|nr:hypothetical protein [Pseudomonas sp. GL-B-19]
MNSLKRFSINLDHRYFRQQRPGVIANNVVGHSRPELSPYGHTGQDVCTLGIQVELSSLEISVEKTFQYHFQYNSAGVPLNHNQTYGSNDFLTPPPNVWNHSPIHTSQFVVDAQLLMDKRLVDEAAWTQNRAITPQEVPDYGDLREPIPANDSDRWMSGICDKPPMPERALWTNA